MSNQEFNNNLFGSVVANFIFTALFAIGAWIKSRLNQSNCKSDCGIFECNSSLIEIQKVKHEQSTQRDLLENIMNELRPSEESPEGNPV